MDDRSWAPVPVDMPSPGLGIRAKRLARTSSVLARNLGPAAVKVVLKKEPAETAISRGARRSCKTARWPSAPL